MHQERFDEFVRATARHAGSRRLLLRGLAGAGIVALDPLVALDAAAKKSDKPAKTSASCRGEGHPCEGNQVCCAGLVCGPSGPGAANRCSAPSTGCASCTVAAVAAYSVSVACNYDADSDRTTCVCTGVAPADAAAVRSVAVSSSAVCADVVGGATLGTPGPAVSGAGFTSVSGQAALTLILAGKATVSGTATYWCMTDAGTVPAQGPGLVRAVDDASPAVGSVEVRAVTCDAGTPVAGGYDWYGRCSQPASGAKFILSAVGAATAAKTAATSADGRVVFTQLSPGSYQLKQTDATWCHAESDGVDATGNVIVASGKRATVWVFDCATAAGGS
jgi:Prealbumin-like fold domain